MSAPREKSSSGGRFSAYVQFVAAVLYFFLARGLARYSARGLADELWSPLIEQGILVFLLLLGYAGMGFWLNGQTHPMKEQGLPRRPGWPHEAEFGLAIGWSLAVVCVLPMVLVGGIAIFLDLQPSAWGWLPADAAFFALLALAEEITFRGYGFQRFVHAVGPLGAALGFAAFYAIVQASLPGGSNYASIAVSLMLGLLLSAAYLRTRALWLSWGINFGWKASRALIFGVAVCGNTQHSPVVQGDPMGPFWITGGAFGLEGSWVTFLILLAALPALFKLTSDLNFRYNAPVIVSGGVAVDLDAAARRQHDAAMGPAAAPAPPGLVQINPALTPPQIPQENDDKLN